MRAHSRDADAGIAAVDLAARLVTFASGATLPITTLFDVDGDEVEAFDEPDDIHAFLAGPTLDWCWVSSAYPARPVGRV